MSEFHELYDELPAEEYERIGADLRRELKGTYVPFDEARAGDMIAAATTAQLRRLPRLAAPLGTAAAVLAVGAGVAVFAASGGAGDNALPPGGGAAPKTTPTAQFGYGVAVCGGWSADPGPIATAPVPTGTLRAIPPHAVIGQATAPALPRVSVRALPKTRRLRRVHVLPMTAPVNDPPTRLPVPGSSAAPGRPARVTATSVPTLAPATPALTCPPVRRMLRPPVTMVCAASHPLPTHVTRPRSMLRHDACRIIGRARASAGRALRGRGLRVTPPPPPTCTAQPGAVVSCAVVSASASPAS